MLAEKIRQLAERLLDKHATLHSIAEHVGPWKNDGGTSEYELTPRDKEFKAAAIKGDLGHADPHVPIGARQVDYLSLTLANGSALTVEALKRVLGSWRIVSPTRETPYSIVFYYPNDKALLSVAVFAELSGPAEQTTTHVTSLLLRRDDVAEALRQEHSSQTNK